MFIIVYLLFGNRVSLIQFVLQYLQFIYIFRCLTLYCLFIFLVDVTLQCLLIYVTLQCLLIYVTLQCLLIYVTLRYIDFLITRALYTDINTRLATSIYLWFLLYVASNPG